MGEIQKSVFELLNPVLNETLYSIGKSALFTFYREPFAV